MPAAGVASNGIYHILDMGNTKYGDAILAVFGDTTILIDGGHPGDWRDRDEVESIPTQLSKLINGPPFAVDLLVVTHCHLDHIGCLPRLVEDGTITARTALVADEGLGYGRDASARLDLLDSQAPEIRGLAVALLEEDHSDLTDADLREFLADAEKLEDKYRRMIQALDDQGTKIIRYGRASNAQLVSLERSFSHTGMKIIGPTQDHLVLCADQIQKLTKDAVDAIGTARTRDSAMSAVDIYRAIMRSGAFVDLLDMYGDGSARNCQSIVLAFGSDDRKVLLAGDMQFAEPQVDDLGPEMEKLKKKIADAGPYAFVKLTHHTSYNGIDEEFLSALGDPRILVHSGGLNDPKHPDRESLRMLKRVDRDRDILFARTDRNGRITVNPSRRGAAAVRVSKGNIDDFSPNTGGDAPTPPAEERAIEPSSALPTRSPWTERPAAAGSSVELMFVRIPYEDGRVDLGGFPVTISGRGNKRSHDPKVETRRRLSTETPRVRAQPALVERPRPTGSGKLANGERDLRSVLFVTDPDRLARNLGKQEAREALAVIEAGAELLAVPGDGAIDATRSRLQRGDKTGAILVGGYDVLPPQRVDVLDPALRRAISVAKIAREPDAFVVWSDDGYVDPGGEGLPDYPISRIPDGRSPGLVLNALRARTPDASGRFGFRNQARPFAATIFAGLRGSETILQSGPDGRSAVDQQNLQRPFVYFMLHGDHANSTSYWGEEDDGPIEAIHVADLPAEKVGVVLAGCCWGALTVNERANHSTGFVSPKSPEQSIALSLLAGGAQAFVGCTGAHYSPDQSGAFFGGPMHRAFWRALATGRSPAQALYDAKVEYLRDIPHGLETPLEVGIERKIYKQFTCLGLGW